MSGVKLISSSSYSPLSNFDEEIRILRLQPSDDPGSTIYVTTTSFRLDTKPSYQALSYCWGTEISPVSTVHNGGSQLVTKNLEIVLRHLRSTSEELHIWIDALCIDQDNVEERSHQVQLMAHIYSTATTVLVWLGEVSNESDLAVETCKKWTYEYALDKSPDARLKFLSDLRSNGIDEKAWVAVRNLINRPYWTRTWIFQEVMLGQEVIVRCGNQQMPWECIEGLLEVSFQVEKREELLKFDLQPKMFAIFKETLIAIGKLRVFENSPKAKQRQAQLFQMLRWTADLSCKDPRDRIYSILQLANDKDDYPKPDYSSSVANVYTDFARAQIINTKCLDILHETACRPAPELSYDIQDRVPSWVPKWTIQQKQHLPYTSSALLYNASANRTLNTTAILNTVPSQLELEGVRVDKIARVAPATVGNLGLPECLAFIDNTDHKFGWRDYRELEGYSHTYPTGEPLVFVFFRTCLLDMEFRFAGRLDVDEHPLLMTQTAEGFLIRLGYDYGVFVKPNITIEEMGDLDIPPFDLDFDFLPPVLAQQYPDLSTFGKFKEHLEKEYSMASMYAALFDRHMEFFSAGRTMLVTDSGYIGLSTNNLLRPGDDLVVLIGCITPVILRPSEVKPQQTHEFVSDCFVHGLMDGEAIIGGGQAKLKDSTQVDSARFENFIIG